MNWMRLLRLFVLFALVCCQNEGGGKDDGSVNADAAIDAGADPCVGLEEHADCRSDGISGFCEVDFDCVLKCRLGGFECITVAEHCGCDRVCYYNGLGNFCEREGDKAEGEPCESFSDCAAPGQCLQETETDPLKCYLVCDNSRPCATGTCTETGFGFGACVEETESDGGVDVGS